MARAPDSKSGCWGFESLLACHIFLTSLRVEGSRTTRMDDKNKVWWDKAKTFLKDWWDKIKEFLKDAKIELKKVTWPSRKQTVASTSVVILVVFIVSVFLGLVDFGLAKIIKLVLG